MEKLQLDGLLLINKPAGMTSFDVLRELKKIVGRNFKIGHAGTLDPFATGLLIVCLGRGTRLVPLLMDVTKGYAVVAHFGRCTDTLDSTGLILEETPVSATFEQDIFTAVALLGSQYKQIPPVFSALKHEGRPLYRIARRGKMQEVELNLLLQSKARWVIIYKLAIHAVQGPKVTFDCEVSKGAYIRSLADDLGKKIGLRATTETLERTFIGPFYVAEACKLEDLSSIEKIKKSVIDVEKARNLLTSC